MCGIVGYISSDDSLYKHPKEHFMRFALALDTLRGHDSTGVMTLKKKFNVSVVKTTMPGDQFVHSKKYHDQVDVGWAQVGHNRAATAGSVNLENAHPFVFGDITLVHNGTLYKDGSSLSTYDKNLPVDSMQIAKALSEHSPEEAKKVLENIDGSFALVWFDKRNSTVNMARNNDRPLHFTYNLKKNIMWFMSDGHHLYSVNKSFKNHECTGQTVYQLDKHKLLKWRKGSLVPEVTSFDPFVPKKSPVIITNKTYGSKGKGNQSLKSSTSQYQNTLKASAGASTKSSTNGIASWMANERTNINDKVRKIPEPHLLSLEQEFDLKPSDLLKFEPEELVNLGNHKYMVLGSVNLEHWANTPWAAMIPFVKEVQANAYRKYAWLVRPVGVGLPTMSETNTAPSVLCHLIHCKWDEYAKTRESNPGKDPEGPDLTNPEVQVQGPDGRYVSVTVLRQMCESGCIQCGDQLKFGQLDGAVYVNEGRDLLCRLCQEETTKELIKAASGAKLN